MSQSWRSPPKLLRLRSWQRLPGPALNPDCPAVRDRQPPADKHTCPPTATSASGPPLNPGIYDDVDTHLIYTGWNLTNVAGAYSNTLHVSFSPGSTITFRFIGRDLRLLYQGGSTLGQIRITIDAVSENLDQSSGSEWVSDSFTNGTHTVSITHVGGGSVNLDQVIIPEPVGTPTVTPTPTRTPNL